MLTFGDISCPHYELVPKDLKANLRWRRRILQEAANDSSFAAAMRKMCAEDILFYFNAFCFTYDPRDQKAPHKPFITYKEYQDESILEMVSAIQVGEDLAVAKSRCMGASWMGLDVFEWFWHFFDGLSFLMISRNEKYVDEAGNPKSLFWKIDYTHLHQPKWLLPTGRWLGWKDPNRKLLHLGNEDTGSVIDGESTTGDAARGDRRTAMFIDEFASFDVSDGFRVLGSSRDVTNCRIFNSTPQGSCNAYYEVVHNTAAKVLRMHWSQHPQCNKGLYTSENGKLKLLGDYSGNVLVRRKGVKKKKIVRFPEEYPFVLDGKLRSPWYDNECSRCASEMEVAQELDIDFLGSDYQFFDPAFIDSLISEYCRPPVLRGDIEFDCITLEPTGGRINAKGCWYSWVSLPEKDGLLKVGASLSGRRFGIGADVSMGTGASNSAASIIDLQNGEKVGLWKSPRVGPKDFADVCMALAMFFNNATLIWDASGAAGKVFTNRVIEKKYRKIYYRRSEGRVRERITDQPGYYLNPEDRSVLLTDYRKQLQERKFINRSEGGMKEALQFIVQPGGKVEHSAAINSQDPTGAREAHGDEVIADALAGRLLQIVPSTEKEKPAEIPYMSPAWRLKEAEEEKRAREREDW